MERRYFELKDVRAEPGEEGRPAKLVGYAAVFESYSEDLGGFQEIVSRGAFAETIAQDDIRALWTHDKSKVLGRTKNGTLRLSEDAIGLRVEITPPDTQWARDAVVSIERGDVDQMSFAFRTLPDGDEWREDKTRGIVRRLNKVKLFEVSPETFPAYTGTRVSARDQFGELPEIPAGLRGASEPAVPEWREARARKRRMLEHMERAYAPQSSEETEDEENS